jgi:hypothetical protein
VLVVERNGSLMMVLQIEHARLVGELMQHWGGGMFERPSPYESVCLAASMHDEGWRVPDEEALYDANKARPLHFLDIDLRQHASFYGKGVERVREMDAYAGLLVGMHWTGLYRGRWGTQQRRVFEPKEGAFLEDVMIEEERAEVPAKLKLLAASSEPRSSFEMRLWMNYELLQACDLLSLFVCMEDLTDDSVSGTVGPVPTGPGKDAIDLQLHVLGGGVVSIDPYPFDVPSLEMNVPFRAIPDRRYESQSEAARHIDGAEGQAISCRLVAAEKAESDRPAIPASRGA